MQSIIYVLLAVSQTMLLVCLAVLYMQWKKSRLLSDQIKNLKSDVTALSLGALGVSKYLDSMTQKQQCLVEKQEKLPVPKALFVNDSEKLYQSAITLVKEGASVDELVSQCHLVREEAELIKMIHSMDHKVT